MTILDSAYEAFRQSQDSAQTGEYIFALPREQTIAIGFGPSRRILYFSDRIELVDHGRDLLVMSASCDPIRQVAALMETGRPAFWIISPDLARRSQDPRIPLIACIQPATELILEQEFSPSIPVPVRHEGLTKGWETECDATFRSRLVDGISRLNGHPQGKMIVTRAYQRQIRAPLDPLRLFSIFANAEQKAACCHFVQVIPGVSSLGCSPENVLEINGSEIAFDIVAGTRGIAADPITDAIWRRELQTCAKERREHMLAFDRYRLRLADMAIPGTERVDFQLKLLDLGSVRHLYSRITGKLRPELDWIKVLCDSFPPLTSYPDDLRSYADDERSPLRYYGGILGRVNPDGTVAQFFLNLRAALQCDRTLYTQGGVGLVGEANPDNELLEVRNKLSSLMKAVQQWEQLVE